MVCEWHGESGTSGQSPCIESIQPFDQPALSLFPADTIFLFPPIVNSHPVKHMNSCCKAALICAFAYCLATIASPLYAQSPAADKFNTEVPKDIIILGSTTDYNSALTLAKQASTKLRRKLDLRGLKPVAKTGLTMSKKDCYGVGGGDDLGYPCYQARGDGNAANDDYISIEYSNAYKGFAKGYYIVVAAITDLQSDAMKTRLATIRNVYPDAYAKRTFIWFGCMH
jgi:hypothetical protein